MNQLGSLSQRQYQFIDDVRLTQRELDVVSCILHCRGSKKIAEFLSISPKTAESHIHNIMLKLGCHARDEIIDFIEKSEHFSVVKGHYKTLLQESLFRKQLQSIRKMLATPKPTCVICYKTDNRAQLQFLKKLQTHLTLVGVTVETKIEQLCEIEAKNTYFISSLLEYKVDQVAKPHAVILLPSEKTPNLERYDLAKSTVIDFREEDHYYQRLLELLLLFIPQLDIQKQLDVFKKHGLKQSSEDANNDRITGGHWPRLLNVLSNSGVKEIIKNPLLLMGGFGLALLVSFLRQPDVSTSLPTQGAVLDYIRPNKTFPEESLFLDRPNLLRKINKQFLSQNRDICTIALVGPGGAGKTTIARYYAQQKDMHLVWEVNAQTRESLIGSFTGLAYALARSSADKKELAIIMRVEQPNVREKYIFSFVKGRLKKQKRWLLIYDNVESFPSIRTKFPYDPKIWGRGQVIITTQDNNIQNNSYIGAHNVIPMGVLTPMEKTNLFLKILGDRNVSNMDDDLPLKKFLNQLPPFPLDVSLAAYYLRHSSISFIEYLKSLDQEEFTSNQHRILENVSDYKRTRHGIIKLSLQKIINVNPDFKDLLLLISLVGPNNIPIALLRRHTSQAVLDHFLHQVKKYSLVNFKEKQIKSLDIHRSIQNMMRTYLTKNPDLKISPTTLSDLAKSLKGYMRHISRNLEETNMKAIVPHAEQFQKNSALTPEIRIQVLPELGRLYYYLGDNGKAENNLKQALYATQKIYGISHPQTAWIQLYLAKVHRNYGDYILAKELMEKSLSVYRKEISANPIKFAWAATHLGNVYRSLGLYIKAQSLLRQSLSIYKNEYGSKHIKVAWASVHLGNVYKSTRSYKSAQSLLEGAYRTFVSHYGANHIFTAWAHLCLARIYLYLDRVSEAQVIYKRRLKLYEHYYGQEHIQTAWVLRGAGRAYLRGNDLEKAEIFLTRSFKLLENLNHADRYRSLKLLSNLYLKKAEKCKAQKRQEESEFYNKKAITALKKSVLIVEQNFSHQSPHVEKLKVKLRNLYGG